MADERGAIDAAILESIAGRYRTDEHVKQVRLTLGDVEGRQRLTITLDPDRYPDHVLKARIEVQWYRNDGFNAYYVETHAEGGTWQCRWDRQRNLHNEREHFHPPPDATDAVDTEYPEDYRDVLSAVRIVIRNRIAALWERHP